MKDFDGLLIGNFEANFILFRFFFFGGGDFNLKNYIYRHFKSLKFQSYPGIDGRVVSPVRLAFLHYT